MQAEAEALDAPTPTEDYWTDQLIELLRAKLTERYAPGGTLRDAHTKSHACLHAEFIIEPRLPPDLQVGLFREPRAYDAWIRLSSSADTIRRDAQRDVLGLAIKVVGLSADSAGPEAQDFLLASCETFFARTLEEFFRFLAAFYGGPRRLVPFLANPRRWRMVVRLARASRRYDSPLTTQYWSMTPYRHGAGEVVKYSIRPLDPAVIRPDRTNPNYLRDGMQAHLDRAEARFEFLVQRRTDPERMPLDDPSVAWSEDRSPLVRVATIRIPPQRFATPERTAFGENLSYSPWHCLPAHTPLGHFNRARRRAYDVLSAFRHNRNDVPRRSPFW